MLLVIGLIIAAVAFLAGIEAFETGFKQSIVDSLIDRNLSIATRAVVWKTKRDPYNGGSANYTGLETDGMSTLFAGETTEIGIFKITSATASRLEITAVSERFPEIGIRTYVNNYDIDSTVISYDGEITLE